MKTLYYFCHSLEDGENYTIGPKGLELARQVGEWFRDQDSTRDGFHKVFHGPSIRTAQTAHAFIVGFGFSGDVIPVVPEVMPVVSRIGGDALLAEITAPSQFSRFAESQGSYKATFLCHDHAKVNQWAEAARAGVSKMFAQLEEDETGVAFGHSPVIELAIASVLGTYDLPEQYVRLGKMEGVVLRFENDRVYLVSKIAMPQQR